MESAFLLFVVPKKKLLQREPWSLSASLTFSKLRSSIPHGVSLPRALQKRSRNFECLLRLPLKLTYKFVMGCLASSAFFSTERSIQTRYGVRCLLRLSLKLEDRVCMDCLSLSPKVSSKPGMEVVLRAPPPISKTVEGE